MSKNQEQMKELINDVRTGKTDKEVLCKEIQKDVNCLIYPVFGEDYKKLSPRAIIDICTNLDSIDVNKNIMRQIATRVSVFMFNLIDNSTIKIDDDYEYEYGRIKEDKELFDIIKDNSRIFKDFKAYDNAPDNIKSLSRVQTIMMELYGYEMHSVDEIETLLDIDSAFILKLIAMMKDNILGISSVVENMSDYASFDEEETDDSDIKIYGAEQKAAETEAADEYEAYEPENADLPDNESDEGIENDESDDEDSDEGVLFEYDMNGYENNDFDDVPVRGVSLMDKLTAVVGSLKYLKMGGRLSGAAAFAGTMLHIPPVVSIEDGKVVVIGKTRGKKAAEKLMHDKLTKDGLSLTRDFMFGHINCSESLETFINKSLIYISDVNGNVGVSSIGCSVGTHVGPGTYGIAYVEAAESGMNRESIVKTA